MRVFISCDIEGITTTTLWDETHTQTQQSIAAPHAQQMTLEVKAACEGAIAAGADYILVKDAHGSGTNIDITQLPECVEVIRNWSGTPY
ncbi:MAG: M55 family metallopeptidase, partial [Oscillospiraceae bacterium]